MEKKDTKFKKGNQAWKLRTKVGRKRVFESPEDLWDAACEYFEWCEDNPLKETKVFSYKGKITKAKVPKMRAPLMRQLCFYLNCNEAYFRQFKRSLPDDEVGFSTVIHDIEAVVYSAKYQGAAADLLNANIIARDLGLVDIKKEVGDVSVKVISSESDTVNDLMDKLGDEK